MQRFILLTALIAAALGLGLCLSSSQPAALPSTSALKASIANSSTRTPAPAAANLSAPQPTSHASSLAQQMAPVQQQFEAAIAQQRMLYEADQIDGAQYARQWHLARWQREQDLRRTLSPQDFQRYVQEQSEASQRVHGMELDLPAGLLQQVTSTVYEAGVHRMKADGVETEDEFLARLTEVITGIAGAEAGQQWQRQTDTRWPVLAQGAKLAHLSSPQRNYLYDLATWVASQELGLRQQGIAEEEIQTQMQAHAAQAKEQLKRSFNSQQVQSLLASAAGTYFNY